MSLWQSVYRDHNKMTDTWANRGADGRTESWVTGRKWEWENIKTIRSIDGSAKKQGRGCGTVDDV